MEKQLSLPKTVFIEDYSISESVTRDIKVIVEKAQTYAYKSVDKVLVQRNWLIGCRIAQEELNGEDRAEHYGKSLIEKLAKELSASGEKGLTASSLYGYVKFYKAFPKILSTLCTKSFDLLSWSHYKLLIRVNSDEARAWYAKEASEQTWSVRQLQRNIQSDYYERIVKTQYDKLKGIKPIVPVKEDQRLEYIKNPVIAEFLGLETRIDVKEQELETAILNNLSKFLMELGKGYAFVARQQHIKTEKEDYYIDLVFYNYCLKCFVLVDLKIEKITHQDVGQMDMYVRMYDELKRTEGDNPTIGIVLCADTDEDIAKYSILNGSEQLFASKYKLYMPSEQELRNEIEAQKHFFALKHEQKKYGNKEMAINNIQKELENYE